MKTRTILDGNAFYEIDEECIYKKSGEKETQKEEKQKSDNKKQQGRE